MSADSKQTTVPANSAPSWTVSTLIATGLIVVLEETEDRLLVSLVPAWAGGPNVSNETPNASAEASQGLSIAVEGAAAARRVARARAA
jgi:hypothetical protein